MLAHVHTIARLIIITTHCTAHFSGQFQANTANDDLAHLSSDPPNQSA